MKVYIETFGCTANRSDETIIKGILKSKNFEFVVNPKDADVSIILTCTVIGTTEQRMLNRIGILKESSKKLLVSGCMASVQADLIRKIAPDAIILPPNRIYQVYESIMGEDLDNRTVTKTSLPRYFDNIRAPISISEGCMFSCSYCITSKARGRLVSYPSDEIVSTVRHAVESGVKEIQLTSQDLASYGLDKGFSIYNLIKKIASIDGEFIIRLGMMNPRTVKMRMDEIVEIYSFDNVYKFFHLPVQSGDNNILERMNRGYRVEDFIEIVDRFRSEYRDITLSTDIIVGFPGEKDDDFYRTVDLIKEIRPDITNITRFSPRPYTKAKYMKDKVPTDISKERSRYLTKLCNSISKERNMQYIGKRYRSLTIEHGKGRSIVARTVNYKPVILKEDLDLGRFVNIEIVGAESTHLVGKLI